jgi:hypothetical protein
LQFSFFLTGVEEEEEKKKKRTRKRRIRRGDHFLAVVVFSGIFFCSYRSLEVFALKVFLFGGLSSVVVVEFVGLDLAVLLMELFLFVVS